MGIPKPVAAVADVFQHYPPEARATLLAVRRLIFETAAGLDGVGPLTETLKWGEPAYLTEESKSGSTIRLGWRQSRPGECALYFNCHTHLISDFRSMFRGVLQFEGNRAVIFRSGKAPPSGPLEVCIGAALTYHSGSRRGSTRGRQAASAARSS